MTFEVGKEKTGGRKIGVKNKIRLIPIKVRLAELKFDLAKELIKLYQDADDDEMRFKVLALFVRYTNAVPKDDVVFGESDDDEDDDSDKNVVNFCK